MIKKEGAKNDLVSNLSNLGQIRQVEPEYVYLIEIIIKIK